MPCPRLTAAIAIALLAVPCHATFPPGPLDCDFFDYSSESFLGQDFGFGTEVKFTQSTPDGFPVESTGLQGFTASPSLIAPIPGFESGQEVPLGGQTLADLFPDTPPSQISDTWAENSISGVGDFTQGFTEFSIQQRKVAGIDQDPEGPTDFADAAAIAKAYASFELQGDTPADAMMMIHLDSLFSSLGGGFGSEGVAVQLLNVTDLDNPELIYEVEGFYFAEEDSLSASFNMGDDDLSDNFTFDPTGGTDDPSLATFSYSMQMSLDPTMTYGINVISDSSAGASGTGSTSIDSSNTLDVTISLLTPGAQLVIPGSSTTGPSPGDANGDGTVDLLDLDILGANFGSTSASFAEGDFNGDAAVDLLDLDILGANFGSGTSSVPEPTAAMLVAMLALPHAARPRSPQR